MVSGKHNQTVPSEMHRAMTMSNAATACATCRQRKTKCDRASPACGHCSRQGWTCPGYEQTWRSCHAKGTQAYKAGPRTTRFRILPAVASNQTTELQRKVVYHLAELPDSLIGSFLPSRYYLNMLPQRIGMHQALDDAIRCVCAVSNISYGNSRITVEQQKAYNIALQTLSIALKNLIVPMEAPYVLAAIMLLQSFEQITDFNARRWVDHAGGAHAMIKSLGPDGFTDEFAYELLFSQLGRINFECFHNKTSCFLDEPAWKTRLRCMSLAMDRCLGNGDISIHDNIKYHLTIVAFPRLLERYRDWEVYREFMFQQETHVHGRYAKLSAELKQFESDLFILNQCSTRDSSITPSRMALAQQCGVASFSLCARYMLIAMESDRQNHKEAESRIDQPTTEWRHLVEQVSSTNAKLRLQSSMAASLQGSALAEVWQALSIIKARIAAHETMKKVCDDLFKLISTEQTTDSCKP